MSSSNDKHGSRQWSPALIGVGVDGSAGSRDAIALGSLLARVTDAELLLIAVHVEPISQYVMPKGMDWGSLQKQAWATAAEERDALAPDALIEVASDTLEWRGLRRMVRAQHADLLVVGSSHDAELSHVRLGHHARELQEHLECPLAIAPRGMENAAEPRLDRVGVGYDGGPEAQAALDLGASIALAAGAELVVRGVAPHGRVASLAGSADAAASPAAAHTAIDVTPGKASHALRELSEQVDLVVIGSSRSAPQGRILLGRTGRALLKDSLSPVIVVPRPVA